MNKLFVYLIIIGVLILLLVSGWEVYQISSGARSTGEITVIEISNDTLIPSALENHLKQDPDYSKFIVSNNTNTNQNDQNTQVTQ